MAVKYTDAFLLDAMQSIESGVSIAKFSREHKCGAGRLRIALYKRLNYINPVTRKINEIKGHSVDIIRAYENGESTLSLSLRYKCSRQVIGRIVRESGAVIRDGSGANKLRMERLSVEQRQAITVHARKSKLENLGAKALANKISYDIGQGEKELFELLFIEDLKTKRQHIVGGYSIDILYRNVAIEIKFRTGLGAVRETKIQRLKKLIESDFIPCYVTINFAKVFHFNAGQILALLNFISCLKPVQGQYWVIECRAQDLTIMQAYVDNITPMDIPPQVKTSITQGYFCVS